MAPGSVTGSRQSLDLDAENHAALCDRRTDVTQGVTANYYENESCRPVAGKRNERVRRVICRPDGRRRRHRACGDPYRYPHTYVCAVGADLAEGVEGTGHCGGPGVVPGGSGRGEHGDGRAAKIGRSTLISCSWGGHGKGKYTVSDGGPLQGDINIAHVDWLGFWEAEQGERCMTHHDGRMGDGRWQGSEEGEVR